MVFSKSALLCTLEKQAEEVPVFQFTRDILEESKGHSPGAVFFARIVTKIVEVLVPRVVEQIREWISDIPQERASFTRNRSSMCQSCAPKKS